jgi:xylan 1,4-beta-xylosidase
VDGVFTELGRLDGRYVSSEVAGGFTGRIVGCFADRGTVRILKFVYIGSDEAAALS